MGSSQLLPGGKPVERSILLTIHEPLPILLAMNGTVFFEAPPRLAGLLGDLAAVAGADRRVCVARELTKLHEEFRVGTLRELAGYYSEHEPRGEITVVLEGTGGPPPEIDRTADAIAMATQLLAEGTSRKETVRRVVDALGVARNDAYRMVMELP